MAFLNALRDETECRIRGSSVVRSGWSLAQATEYLRSLPIDLIKAQAVRGAEGSAWALSDAEKDAYLDDLEAIGLQVVSDLEAGRMPKDDRFSSWVLQLLKGVDREFYCGAGRTVFGVTPSGDILPCVLLDVEAHRLGHVEDTPVAFVEAGKRWRNSRLRRPECTDCGELSLCGGGCPAMLSVCGAEECLFARKECQVARSIFARLDGNDSALFRLAGITWE
jgi:radical SAM protein with 4Fe4S-binding SPASM domain